jgi:2-polyprenyl-6-methoxyphenol hydroxylase-like FAD-dependent oxidoreductase
MITVGGGLGGSALAKAMAERGYKVLVVEREKQFKDRVRGEFMSPWGVAEAKELGIYDTLMATGGYHPTVFDVRLGPASVGERDLSETTPQGVHALTMYHPELQDVLLGSAEDAGATIRRGVKVTSVAPGREPCASITSDGGTENVSARLVVGADGRQSSVRKWAGFEVTYETLGLQLGGVLMEGMRGVDDRSVTVFNPFVQRMALIFPQGNGRARVYFGNRADEGFRPQGDKDVPRFIEECIKTGSPAEFYEGAEAAGPLATFPGIYDWVEHPYKNGVALVGDAATTSDQTWGQGLSLTLGAVRRLRDALVANDDWSKAGEDFAVAMRAMWEPIRNVEHWFTEIFMGASPEANGARTKALPLIAQDPSRVHDAFMSGPDCAPADEAARRRFFGEE